MNLFFFQSGPHFSIRGGEQRGLDPLPPGFNPQPPPPVFSLFFFRVPPPKIKILGDCSCVICVFFYVRKSCHFTTVFLVGRYFYLHVFTLSLGLWIFFFQSGPHFSIRGGEQRGLDPLPPGFNPLPPPILFLPTPPPVFSLFFFQVPRPKLRFFFCSAPIPFSVKSPPTPTPLTHWGRATHICVSKLAIIASDNGLSPGRRQAIIETNDGILLIWSLGTNFSEILIKIHSFSFKKMHLKMSSGKWRPFCLSLNVLTPRPPVLPHVSDKTSYHKKLWSLEDMRLVTCIIHHTTAEVPAPFQSDRTILNTNLAASKNLRDLTIRRLLRCFNIR